MHPPSIIHLPSICMSFPSRDVRMEPRTNEQYRHPAWVGCTHVGTFGLNMGRCCSEPSRAPLHLKPCVGSSCHPCVQSDSFKVSASHTFHWGLGDKLAGSSFHGSEHSKVKTAGSQMPPFQLPLPYNLLSLQHSDPPRMEPASTQDTGGSGKLEAKLGCVDRAQASLLA